MTKIAFYALGDEIWQAGYIYIINLLHALRMRNNHDEIYSLLLSNATRHIPDDLKNLVHETIVFPSYQRWSIPWFMDQAIKRLFWYDLLQNRLLEQHQIDIISFGEAPRGSNIPFLPWLPDFQHVHLPEMFSSEECLARNHSFMHIAEKATRVLLLSESVKRDFEVFAPEHAYKTRVLSPVSYIPLTAYDTDPELVVNFYHLPRKFIYLPNQFWKHKNHVAAFHALKILKAGGTEVSLVCSGNLTDYRHPDYWSDLMQDISCLGIRNQIATLGLIPRENVFQLMRQSVCVLNPSLFEGYGMTIDEARSLGKRVLLSDLPVHHEQNPHLAVFFDPNDYEDLANKIEMLWSAGSPGPDLDLEKKARQELQYRLNDFAESFMSIVREVSF